MPGSQREEKYSAFTGIVFLFNLIVGTGALALPGALQRAGLLAGVLLLMVLGVFSYVTVTFIVESLAAANAITKNKEQMPEQSCENVETSTESSLDSMEATPLVTRQDNQENIFEITEKFELGQIGVMVTPKWCQVIIYLCLCVYLFGDLAIYAAVIGRTFSSIICSRGNNSSTAFKLTGDIRCWEDHPLSRLDTYRLCIAVFILLMGPFVFFNLQKTKILQIFTSLMRWLAFFIMLIWSLVRLCTMGAEGHPPVINISALPTLFGTLVYSFMCQHSIPGLLQPIKIKRHLKAIIAVDYGLVSTFYLLLSITAIFAFKKLQDIYTLNFWEESSRSPLYIKFLAYYLALFPIFTLSTNFPIIGITLRNNLRSMFLRDAPPRWYFDKFTFPLLTILPPTILALIVSDLRLLVGIVGSYAGACVQYLIPCLLVFYSRSLTQDLSVANIHASPFRHKFWIYAVFLWMGFSLILITVNIIINWE